MTKHQTLLGVMYSAVVGLIIVGIIAATRRGTSFWDQMSVLGREGVEMTHGAVDLPTHVPGHLSPTLQVFFIIFLLVIVLCTIVLCHSLRQGFGMFWLQFPFQQYALCQKADQMAR